MPTRLAVAGGGLAGLLGAAAVAPHVDEVVVLDPSDGLNGSPGRSGHSLQLHNILTRGQRHLEELMPGFRERLLDEGAVEGSVADETHVFEFGGQATERALGLTIWGATWGMLRKTILSMLPPNVTCRGRTTVDCISIRSRRPRALTVKTPSGKDSLSVDGLIDATGHGRRIAPLLADLGLSIPPTSERHLMRWFTTIRLRRPDDWVQAPDFWMVFGDPPDRDAALISPIHSDEWLLSLSSQSGSAPPRDLRSIHHFLDQLPGPPLRPVVDRAEPLGMPTVVWRHTARWCHYERATDPLEGYAPIGDSYASVNPVYGQGVSVAAWQASLLREAVRLDDDGASWARRYLSRAWKPVAWAWALDDVPVPAIDVAGWVRLANALQDDSQLQRRYIGIWHLLESPSALGSFLRLADSDTTGGI